MNWKIFTALAFLSTSIPLAAIADPIPGAAEAMIRKAADSGDSVLLASTADVAKRTYPNSAAEIDALVAQLKADADQRHHDELASEGFFDGWKGQGQAGFANSTGNTRNTGIALGLNFERDGLDWKHTFIATVDYARDNGVEDKNREFASYEADYKFSERLYALGLFSWEADRFSGFSDRFSEALGLGYQVIDTPDMKLALEAGPALRQTNYILGDDENNFAGRAALHYQWQILAPLLFNEDITYYGASNDSTVTSNTALTMKLIGALSAQASFLVQYETSPPFGLDSTDTTTRLTLVYSF
jgi:putative salt-induced outer membrane protein